jgi:hypothetical protein
MKIRLKEKHRELGRHYARFVDKRWHPDFVLDDRTLEIFMRVESAGRSSCSKDELQAAAPLLNGKMQRELTIKLMFDEMADWWSMGAGWFAPLAHTLHAEMWSHGLAQRDRVYIRALVKIMRSCREDGFMETLLSFTGMTQEDKNRYLNRWLASNPAPIPANAQEQTTARTALAQKPEA